MSPSTSSKALAPRRSVIVGTGSVAQSHARALRHHAPRTQLVSVVDLDDARAQDFARRWQVPQVRTDLADALAEDAPDLVHICTPPAPHEQLVVQGLEAGATVVVEKPTTVSLAGMDRLIAAERNSAGQVATVFQHRFGPGAVRARELVARDAFGPAHLAVCTTAWFRDDEYYAAPWRGTWAGEGGGPTLCLGVHLVDMMLSIEGDWVDVTAVTARRARPTETEDLSMAVVTLASGALVSVTNSVLSPRQSTYLRLDHARASLEVEHLYGYREVDWRLTPAPGCDDALTAWTDAGGLPGPGPGGPGDVAAAGARPVADTGHVVRSGHTDHLGAVLDALDKGEAPPVTLADARRTMELVTAVYASAARGRHVAPGDIGPEDPFAHGMRGDGRP